MVQCWLMAKEFEDQRLECHRQPKQFISVDKLKKLGVVHRIIPVENYKQDLIDFSKSRGYNHMDEVKLGPSTVPDYETLIKTFFEEHLHKDEEVRYMRDGNGYFDIRDENNEWIRIRCEPGDFLILPAGIYHRFTEYVDAVRLFKNESSWTPYNRSEHVDKLAERVNYVSSVLN